MIKDRVNNEPISARQEQALQVAREKGRVTVNDLTASCNVTPQTIRKDLNDLCERGLLQRVHGGAVVSPMIENVGYDVRRVLCAEEKRLIGQRAASLIPNHCSLFIDLGTTTEQVAVALTGHQSLLVITNNFNVASTFLNSKNIDVILTGGMMRHSDGGLVGEAAIDFIKQFRADYAVIGVSAIDEDGALLEFDYREVRVGRAILENSRHKILVADSTKFARTAPVRLGHIGEIDIFVTDTLPSKGFVDICKQHDVALEISDFKTE